MNVYKKLASLLAIVALAATVNVYAQFDCTGNGNCNIVIDGLSDACITQIEITNGPLTASTGSISLSICDYKALDGICFDLGLDPNLQHEVPCQVVQEQEPTGYRFKFKTYVEARVPGYPGTFRGDRLLLESINTYPNQLGDNPGPIPYMTTKHVVLTNGQGNTLLLERGSNVQMVTQRSKVRCTLTGQCEIFVGGQSTSINPIVEIESQSPVDAGGGVLVSIVDYKKLTSGVIEMDLFDAADSRFVLEPVGPDGYKVYAELNVVVTFNGEAYFAPGPLVLESQDIVPEFPGSGVGYFVQAPTEFVSDGGDVIVIQKGFLQN